MRPRGLLPLAIMGALALGACSTVSTLEPYRVEVKDLARYNADKETCRGYALAYKRGLSVQGIGEAAAKGGAQNLAGAALNPLVPVLGALGSGTSETLSEFGLSDIDQVRIFLTCLGKKTDRDGSALVLEPLP